MKRLTRLTLPHVLDGVVTGASVVSSPLNHPSGPLNYPAVLSFPFVPITQMYCNATVSKCSLYVFAIIPPRLSDPRNFITVLLVTREPEQTTLLF